MNRELSATPSDSDIGRDMRTAATPSSGRTGMTAGRNRCEGRRFRSALAELEALAGLLVAVLLPLDHPGVSGEEVGVAEGGQEVGTVLGQGS